jgi:hypothetical protein
MSIEETIIKYLDNQLTEEEKNNFEIELNNSAKLKNEFLKFQSVKLKTDELKQIETNEAYYNSIIPRFRNKLKINSGKIVYKKIAFALSILIVTAISYMVYYTLYVKMDSGYDLAEFTESLSDKEKLELLEELDINSDVYSEEYFNNLNSEDYKSALQESLIDTEDKKQLADLYDIEITEPGEFISYQEFELIYDELLNMNFFKEEKL